MHYAWRFLSTIFYPLLFRSLYHLPNHIHHFKGEGDAGSLPEMIEISLIFLNSIRRLYKSHMCVSVNLEQVSLFMSKLEGSESRSLKSEESGLSYVHYMFLKFSVIILRSIWTTFLLNIIVCCQLSLLVSREQYIYIRGIMLVSYIYI